MSCPAPQGLVLRQQAASGLGMLRSCLPPVPEEAQGGSLALLLPPRLKSPSGPRASPSESEFSFNLIHLENESPFIE